MKKFLAIILGALMLSPIAAAAAPGNSGWTDSHGIWHSTDGRWRDADGSWHDRDDQRWRDARWLRQHERNNGYYNNGYNNNGYYNNGYHNNGYYNNGYRNGNYNSVTGRIASVNGGSIRLQNGRTVFLKSYTTINGSLQPGERIAVSGSDAGDGNINANAINVVGY